MPVGIGKDSLEGPDRGVNGRGSLVLEAIVTGDEIGLPDESATTRDFGRR